MTRVLAYTLDGKLHSLLAPALGKDIQLVAKSDEAELKAALSESQWDVLLIDLGSSPESVDGASCLFDDIVAGGPPVIIMADDEARSQAIDLVQRGAHSYCRTPPAIRELKALISRAHEVTSMKRELESKCSAAAQPDTFDDLIGTSASMKRVYDLVRRVADLNASVLINGPSGTGTLFLDEIGELSLSTQVKLLRVLQEREFCRLGGNRPIPLKARVILATHRDLKRMVAEGKFRLDLYYRINVMTINAPALVDHQEDIPALANHFVKKYSAAYDKHVDSITLRAMQMLMNYEWPGNVRELENVIQGSIIRTDTDAIDACDLPEYFQESESHEDEPACVGNGTFDRLLRDYKFKLATRALHDCGGNKTLASRSLDISRAYLHRLLKLNDREEYAVESDLSETA